MTTQLFKESIKLFTSLGKLVKAKGIDESTAILCKIVVSNKDGIYKYLGLFPTTSMALIDAQDRYGVHCAITVNAMTGPV